MVTAQNIQEGPRNKAEALALYRVLEVAGLLATFMTSDEYDASLTASEQSDKMPFETDTD